MPSSPADPGALPPASVLQALARAYDEALAAAASGDLEACAHLLDAGDALLAAPLARGEDLQELHQAACAAHARLQSVLRGLHGEVAEELGRLRSGRKALAGYGGEREIGGRVQSRA